MVLPTASASSLMLMSSPEPTLMWLCMGWVRASSVDLGRFMTNTLAAAMSSTYRNSRRGVPLPQMLTPGALATLAS